MNSSYQKLKRYEKLLKYSIILISTIIVFVPLYKSYKHRIAAKGFIISEESVNLGMLHPKYEAKTSNNKLFKINAYKSLNQNENKTIFYKINGNMKSENRKKINFSSSQGVYDKRLLNISFTEGVKFFSKDEGFELNSNRALYLLKEGFISGSQDIDFANYMGRFRAEEYNVSLADKSYVFYNNIIFIANDINKTVIESQKMVVSDANNVIEVEDEAQYKDYRMVLTSDRFISFYKKDNSEKISIEKVIASGNVKILHESSVIVGNRAMLYPDKDIVEIMGDVIFEKEENVIKGEKIIYDIKNESFRVLQGKKNKVNLQLKHE